jgi:maltose O-acetyltransferase
MMLKDFLIRIGLKCGLINRQSWLRSRGLTLGQGCAIMEEVWLDMAHLDQVTIGHDVTLAPRVMILAHDASANRQMRYTRIAPVRIGDRVFIGAGTIVLPGVTIGENSIIGAGSVVTKDIPSNVVAYGNPASVRKSLDVFLRKQPIHLTTARKGCGINPPH